MKENVLLNLLEKENSSNARLTNCNVDVFQYGKFDLKKYKKKYLMSKRPIKTTNYP